MTAEAFPWRDVADVHLIDLTPDLDGETLTQALDRWGSKVLDLTDLNDQAVEWERIQELKKALTLIESMVAPAMYENIPARPGWVDTPAGVMKRTYRGAKTTWDDEAAMAAVVDYATEHREYNSRTGEVETEVQAAVRHLKASSRINYWLMKELKSRGIDPEKYLEREPGRPWVTRV